LCFDNETHLLLYVGEKSNDKDTPAFVPTLFSFTDSPTKYQIERSLEQWKALQERRKIKDALSQLKKQRLKIFRLQMERLKMKWQLIALL